MTLDGAVGRGERGSWNLGHDEEVARPIGPTSGRNLVDLFLPFVLDLLQQQHTSTCRRITLPLAGHRVCGLVAAQSEVLPFEALEQGQTRSRRRASMEMSCAVWT